MGTKFKGICSQCHEEEVYSETLTNGLCLNCYQQNKIEDQSILAEGDYDYDEGLL